VAAPRWHSAQSFVVVVTNRAGTRANWLNGCARQRRGALVTVPGSPRRHCRRVAHAGVWTSWRQGAPTPRVCLPVHVWLGLCKAAAIGAVQYPPRAQPATSFHATCCGTSALLNAPGELARLTLTPSTSAGCSPGARSSVGDHAVVAGHAGFNGGGVYSHDQNADVDGDGSAAAANVATRTSRARHRRHVIVSLVLTCLPTTVSFPEQSVCASVGSTRFMYTSTLRGFITLAAANAAIATWRTGTASTVSV